MAIILHLLLAAKKTLVMIDGGVVVEKKYAQDYTSSRTKVSLAHVLMTQFWRFSDAFRCYAANYCV